MTEEQFESEFGKKLPAAYVLHMGSGGTACEYLLEVDQQFVEFCDEYGVTGPAVVRMSSLLYLNSAQPYSSMPRQLELLRNYRDLPDHLIPIARCWNSDVVLLDIEAHSQRSETEVLFWDHESGDMYRVCSSLESFLGQIREAPSE